MIQMRAVAVIWGHFAVIRLSLGVTVVTGTPN